MNIELFVKFKIKEQHTVWNLFSVPYIKRSTRLYVIDFYPSQPFKIEHSQKSFPVFFQFYQIPTNVYHLLFIIYDDRKNFPTSFL